MKKGNNVLKSKLATGKLIDRDSMNIQKIGSKKDINQQENLPSTSHHDKNSHIKFMGKSEMKSSFNWANLR